MSILTTLPIKQAPSAADGVTVTHGGSWSPGSWVEVLASAPSGMVIAGVYAHDQASSGELELEIGVGASGSETPIGRMRMAIPGGLNKPLLPFMFPVPVAGISSGQRVAIRTYHDGFVGDGKVTLLYYEGFSGDTLRNPACVPSAADGASVTPNGTAWANSSWVELTSGFANGTMVYGVTLTAPVHGVQIEVDLGTGAAGAETVIQTLRFSRMGVSHDSYFLLPKVYSLPANTRVALRMRKSGTDTTAHRAVLLYYNSRPQIRCAYVFGERGRVTSARTFLANLDGVARTVNAEGSLAVGGNVALIEQGTAPTPIAGMVRIFAEDDGSGKLRLMAQFPTGAAQQIAIEP